MLFLQCPLAAVPLAAMMSITALRMLAETGHSDRSQPYERVGVCSIVAKPSSPSVEAAAARALAGRARRLARALFVEDDRRRLIAYADELDSRASKLEREGAPRGAIVQQQTQVQQQRTTEPAPQSPQSNDSNEKP